MKFKFMRSIGVRIPILVSAIVVLASSAALAASRNEPESVTIYPINRAAIMAGARFDFKIEFPEALAESDIEITVAGKTPSEMFGAAGSMIVEKYQFPKPANKVEAKAEIREDQK